MLSKVSLMGLSHATLGVLGRTAFLWVYMFPFLSVWTPSHPSFHRESASYHEAKQAATTYQAAKRCLIGPNAPFAGWVVSGEEWESFDVHGELRSEAQARQHN
jgi:hypothetical protein